MLILRTITLELIVWRSELAESIGWLVSLVETIKFKEFHLRCCIRFIQTRKIKLSRFSTDIDLLFKFCGMEKETTQCVYQCAFSKAFLGWCAGLNQDGKQVKELFYRKITFSFILKENLENYKHFLVQLILMPGQYHFHNKGQIPIVLVILRTYLYFIFGLFVACTLSSLRFSQYFFLGSEI